MIEWQYYPKAKKIEDHLIPIVEVFEKNKESISSSKNKLVSDDVLRIVSGGLESLGYLVEKSKRSNDKIKVPVLFGRNGKLEKYFDADAYNQKTQTVIEVEAGRGVTNYQFLKDLFQACMMHDVEYLVIAVRTIYGKNNAKNFETMATFFDTLYASDRLQLPLNGILIIGY